MKEYSDEIMVSICCITYNHANFIRDSFEGFLMQKTNFPIEIIIHDDASTDGTSEIIKEYSSKHPDFIIPIIQSDNQWSKGITISPTFVWPLARGKYIALCEGDDYWTDPLKLQKQVDFLEANKDYVACFTNAKIINEIDSTQSVFVNGLKEGKVSDSVIGISGGALYPTCSLLFRMSNFKAKLFLDIPELAGDDLLILSLAQQGNVFFLNDVTCVYRRQQNGVYSSISKNYVEIAKFLKKSNKGYLKLLKDKNFEKFHKQIRRRISVNNYFIIKHKCSTDFWNDFLSLNYKEAIKLVFNISR